MGIGQTIHQTARRFPEKPALIYEGEVLTYKQFYETVCKLRTHLKKLAPNEKPTIAMLIGNEPAFLELFFAVITIGGMAAPFDPKWSKQEAETMLRKIQPDVVIASKQFLATASYSIPATDIDELKQLPAPPDETAWNTFQDEPFYLGFTSGTTGMPKGYIRSHRSWLESFRAAEKVFHLTEDATILAPGPLCHSLSLCSAVHALHLGATFYLTSFAQVRNMLHKMDNMFLFAVPSMLYVLADERKPIDQKITFVSAGDKLDHGLVTRLRQAYPNSRLFEYYGASELSYVSYTKHHDAAAPHAGKPFPGVDITIRTEDGSIARPGEIGQIYIHSPFLFTGYVTHPKETKNVLTPYGATVGDIGFFNKNGALSIIGRKKNMIITGGLNVYPEEVEKVIKEVPAVKEAVVIGKADPLRGQKIIALIQWNTDPDILTVQAHCKRNLATYKIPKKFLSVSDFPRTSSGKIDRQKLQKKGIHHENTCHYSSQTNSHR